MASSFPTKADLQNTGEHCLFSSVLSRRPHLSASRPVIVNPEGVLIKPQFNLTFMLILLYSVAGGQQT